MGPWRRSKNQSERAQVQGNSNRLQIQPGNPGAEGDQASEGKAGLPSLSQLMPSQAALDKITSAPRPTITSRTLEQGEGTFLNTKEWKYATFFNRVKQAVGRSWDPNEPLRQRDPTGEIYGGAIATPSSTSPWGRRAGEGHHGPALERGGLPRRAAVVSFRRAQPFPNPPPGLMGKDGTVTFPLGFYLETGGRPLMRIFRNN